jgi:hypothetical protein
MAFVQASLMAVPALVGAGCILPPNFSVEEGDAGISNSPPEIVSAGPDGFEFPGEIVLDRGATETRRLRLTVRDSDLDDTLYARFFVDYELDQASPSPFLVSCTGASGSEVRTHDCAVQPLCSQLASDDTDRHLLEVMVADRAFLDQGDPQFRALPDGALFTIRSWIFKCNLEQ